MRSPSQQILEFRTRPEDRGIASSGVEMASDSGPDHDPFKIDRLAVLAVSLPGADRTEETVFGEYPHGSVPRL